MRKVSWSLIIASVPLFIVILYTQGQKRLYAAFIPLDKDFFLSEYTKQYNLGFYLKGTALFFARKSDTIPAYIGKTIFKNGIVYERNIIVTVTTSYEPHGITTELTPLAQGLDWLKIETGYMETLNVEALLKERHIEERSIFYGNEEIVSSNIFWKIFAFIKDVSPNFVSFYHFPHEKLIGVSRRAEI